MRIHVLSTAIAAFLLTTWLVLAASDPNPQDALAYAQKALEINPESARARRGVEWALSRVKQTEAGSVLVERSAALNLSEGRNDAFASLPKRVYRGTIPAPQLKINGQNWLYPTLLIGAGCMLVGLIALFALTSPALASIVSSVSWP
ncbi:MAG: hypothetical protein ACREK6_11945, partial [Candidatus Rokuibacteriota bacterium]